MSTGSGKVIWIVNHYAGSRVHGMEHRHSCRYEKNDARRVLNMVEFSARLALLEVGGHSPRHPFVQAMARAERLGYEKCDYTVSLLGGAKDYMVAHGLDEKKFVYIPNGIEPEAAPRSTATRPEEHLRISQKLKRPGTLLVLYSGTHGPANALGTMIEAARLLQDEPRLQFLLVGQGPEKQALQQQAQQAGLTNVTFLPPVARTQMPALTHAVDVGYIGLQRQDLFKYGVSPNKLFEYMSAALPVLFAIETAYNEVAQAWCGFSIPAEDPPALAQALRRVVQLPEGKRRAMGERGRRYVQSTHTYEVLAQQYARLF